MILEAINQKPFIHFGFNRQSITAGVNEPIIVWQDKMIDGLKQSEIISYNTEGVYTHKIFSSQEVESNELTITII